MPSNGIDNQAHQILEDALIQAEALKHRIEAGEQVSQEELNSLAQNLAQQLNAVRAQIEDAFGPIDTDKLAKHLETQLSPEEFAAWKSGEIERRQLASEQILSAESKPKGELR